MDQFRYKTLIEARNYHYDNFSKWMTYFYVAIGVLVVTYFSIQNTKFANESRQFMEWLIAILGFVVGLFLYWSSKGYYYWNIHWINLINKFEKENIENLNERIYSVFSNKQTNNNYFIPVNGANISTSKITILFGFIIAVVWGIIISYKLFSIFGFKSLWMYPFSVLVSLIVTVLISFIPQLWLKSDLGMLDDLEYYPKGHDRVIKPRHSKK